MKSPLRKLRGFALPHKGRREPLRPPAKLDELVQAAQDMLDMRNCYDSLVSAAATTTNSAYEFSEALEEMGTCLLQKTSLSDDDDSGRVLLMLGKAQFELQKLVDDYRSHIVQTITTPSESLLKELHIVEVVGYVGEIVGLRVADKREIGYQSGRRLQYKSACYFVRIDKEHIIDATRKGGIARFVNHSCQSNCAAKVILSGMRKRVEIEGGGKTWKQDQRVRIRHADTGGYLHSHGKKYTRITGEQKEVCGVPDKYPDNLWDMMKFCMK